LSEPTVAEMAEIILSCLHREYPNHVSLLLRDDEGLAPPRELYPAFFGSFDWHSSVHGHWSLARAIRVDAGGEIVPRAREALRASLTREKCAGERRVLEERPGFECPYGLAWLLLLGAELEQLGSPLAAEAAALEPVVQVARRSVLAYLDRLTHPVRSGQHDQSAFGLGLALDAARIRGDEELTRAVEETALRLHAEDRDAPLHFEPSNHDFLSPAFAAAELISRILPAEEFSDWLARALPGIPTESDAGWFPPIDCPDPSHGHLSHRIGLNLSRAWMLEAVTDALPAADSRRPALAAAASRHRARGLAEVDPRHYAGAHWLGTFAIHLLTGRSRGPRPN